MSWARKPFGGACYSARLEWVAMLAGDGLSCPPGPCHRARVFDALVLGLGATGLAVARALGRRGLRVAAADPRRWEIGGLSRYITRVPWSVDALATVPGQPVVFAAGDPELHWLCQHHERFSDPNAPILEPSLASGAVLGCLDKRILYRRCQELGILMPHTWIGTPFAAIADAAQFPLVVKPALGGAGVRVGSGKVRWCETAADLLALSVQAEEVVVQQWLPGSDASLYVCALVRGTDGHFGPDVVGQKLRQWPRGIGSGACVQALDPDRELSQRIRDASRRLVAALGLTGFCATEWKLVDGALVHIEVNARPVLWAGLAEAVLLHAWRLARGVPGGAPVQRAGTRWRYLLRDWAAGGPLRTSASERFALEALDDPLPGLAGPAYSVWLQAARWSGRR